jgi:hypothetical protein
MAVNRVLMAPQGSAVHHIEAFDVSFLMMYDTWGAAGILYT